MMRFVYYLMRLVAVEVAECMGLADRGGSDGR